MKIGNISLNVVPPDGYVSEYTKHLSNIFLSFTAQNGLTTSYTTTSDELLKSEFQTFDLVGRGPLDFVLMHYTKVR